MIQITDAIKDHLTILHSKYTLKMEPFKIYINEPLWADGHDDGDDDGGDKDSDEVEGG